MVVGMEKSRCHRSFDGSFATISCSHKSKFEQIENNPIPNTIIIMSNLPTVDENNPCSSAGPAFTPSVAPPQEDDEYSFASDVTTERVKSFKSIREQKLTLLFGSDFKIQRNQLEGYIEFRSIVEAAPEKFEDSAVAGFLGDLIAGTSCFEMIHGTIHAAFPILLSAHHIPTFRFYFIPYCRYRSKSIE